VSVPAKKRRIKNPVIYGGRGSGNFGHAGRPGAVGGSGGGTFTEKDVFMDKQSSPRITAGHLRSFVPSIERADFREDREVGQIVYSELSRLSKDYNLPNGEIPLKEIKTTREIQGFPNCDGLYSGLKNHTEGRIQLIVGLPKEDTKLQFGNYTVTDSVAEIFRHELGHSVWYNSGQNRRNDWEGIYKSQQRSWWSTNISFYSSDNHRKAFAESFAAYTHRDYGKSPQERLPRNVESYFEKNYKKSPLTQSSTSTLKQVQSINIYAQIARVDPTKTLVLRNNFAAQMAARFRKLKAIIQKAVVDDDCFGIAKPESQGKRIVVQGGEGSDNFGHAGRPGAVGGSGGGELEDRAKSVIPSLASFVGPEELKSKIVSDLERMNEELPGVKSILQQGIDQNRYPLKLIDLSVDLSKKGASGSYHEMGGIKLGEKVKVSDTEYPLVGTIFTLSGDHGVAVFRHELGHSVYDNLTGNQKKSWEDCHTNRDLSRVSLYATSNEHEGFAEAFSAYTHPNYGKGKGASLPQGIVGFFDKHLRKSPTAQTVYGGSLTTQADLSTRGGRAFDFPTSQEKSAAFLEWLRTQEQAGILETVRIPQVGTGIDSAWTDTFIKDSYQRGVQRARDELLRGGYAVPSMEVTGGISASMMQPFHIDRLGVAYSRAFDGLKGITSAMDTQISHVLTKGLADGDGQATIAKKLLATIDGNNAGTLGITDSLGRFIPAERRAAMLARTEVIRAHAMGTLQEAKNWGAAGVYAEVEFINAGFNVCPECTSLQGQMFTIEAAMDVIPVHPSCRCAWLIVPVSGKGEVIETLPGQPIEEAGVIPQGPGIVPVDDFVPMSELEAGTTKSWIDALGYEDLPVQDDNYYYHASFANNLVNIEKEGLVPGLSETFKGYGTDKLVSISPDVRSLEYWSQMGFWQKYDLAKAAGEDVVERPILLRVGKNEITISSKPRIDEILTPKVLPDKLEIWNGKNWASLPETPAAGVVEWKPANSLGELNKGFEEIVGIKQVSFGDGYSEIESLKIGNETLEHFNSLFEKYPILKETSSENPLRKLWMGKSIWLDAEGVMGRYYKNDLAIDIGAEQIKDHTLTIGKYEVGKDYFSTLRHEYAHFFHGNGLTLQQREDWSWLYRTKTQLDHSFSVSIYGAANEGELFAESFSAYTSPLYKPGMLPKEIESYFDKLLKGKSLTTQSKPQVNYHVITTHGGQGSGNFGHAGRPGAVGGSGGGGDTMEFFHGTSSEYLQSIQEHGIIPGAKEGADSWAVKRGWASCVGEVGDHKVSVYMTPSLDHAKSYAELVSKELVGGQAVVVKVNLPIHLRLNLRTDEKDKSAVRYVGKIKPAWIEPIQLLQQDEVVTFYVVAVVKSGALKSL